MGALEGLTTDIGGLKVGFSATSHQGAKDVFLTVVRGGSAARSSLLHNWSLASQTAARPISIGSPIRL